MAESGKERGTAFGVSEHLAASFTWFQKAHRRTRLVRRPAFLMMATTTTCADLYHQRAYDGDDGWMSVNPAYQKEWYSYVKELIDMYHPDLLYSDRNTFRQMRWEEP